MTLTAFIPCANVKEARKIAKKILEKRLAACCNIVPTIESQYWWKGKVDEEQETLLILKTREQLKEALQKEVEKLHSYELPVIEFFKTELNKKAEEWVEKETKKGV